MDVKELASELGMRDDVVEDIISSLEDDNDGERSG
jgi:hypothetical protein